MDTTTFVRKPFTVEAVEITADNIEEIASRIGTLKYEDGVPYIAIDRRIVRDISRAHVGFWLTEMRDNFKVYNPTAFRREFVEAEDDTLKWVAYLEKKAAEAAAAQAEEAIELPQPAEEVSEPDEEAGMDAPVPSEPAPVTVAPDPTPVE